MNSFIFYLGFFYILVGTIFLSVPIIYLELGRPKDLVKAFYDFQESHVRYNAFLNREIMEKYIGSLDGNNLQRNLDFIYELLEGGLC